MATCREATPPGVHKPGPGAGGDDSELDVFAAERYFNGDDALWCAGSSSSFSSSAFRTGTTHEHDRSVATATAATSSSEASWNSRSALLLDVKVNAAPSVVKAEPPRIGGEPPRGKPSPPSSHLRRWLFGVAGCACIGGDDGQESASADELCREEVEDDNVVAGRGGELLPRTEGKKELAVVEATASVRVRAGRWLDDGEELLTGRAAFSPVQVQLAGDGHRRAGNSGEFSTPILDRATTAASLHERRRKSSEMLRPLGDIGNALVSTKQDPAFTIVAGNTARSGGLRMAAASGGSPAVVPRRPGISPCDTSEEDAAPSEVGCAYPPSEASVVWSVVTAEGAASCNFSSAASGYYYHFNGGEDLRHAAGRSNRRRRSGATNGGGLLTCMGDSAVNAVGPARRLVHRPEVGHDGYPR